MLYSMDQNGHNNIPSIVVLHAKIKEFFKRKLKKAYFSSIGIFQYLN